MEGSPPPASPAGLSAYVAVSQLLGLTLLATTGAWLGRYRGGVAWHGHLQFNVHPLCMVLGMVFLQGDGEQDKRPVPPPPPPPPAAFKPVPPTRSCSRAGSERDKTVTNEAGKMLQGQPHLGAAPLGDWEGGLGTPSLHGCSSALSPAALLVYRVFRHEAKRSTKALHALLHGLALVIALVGIVAVFESHRAKGIPNMYSLHSWCGMAAFVLYLLQWLLGCGFFLLPGASFSLRSRYKPLHVFLGIALLALSIAACLLGITEMLLFNIRWVTELGGEVRGVVPPPPLPTPLTPSKGLLQPRGAVRPLLRPWLPGY
uniref:Transmembrane ascorbate-dependent reductase CYB561 n=1 Tax=Calidris pygmaea TaxID=425635 RepID=A0A8C3KKS2_9CHAR